MIGWGNGLPGIPAGSRRGLVSTLPGIVARYQRGESGGWPDVIGGVGDGVHTGAPSTVAEGGAVGMSYDGATQYTTIGDVTSFNEVHQGAAFSLSAWIIWDGPSTDTDLHSFLGSTTTTSEKGFFFFVEDRTVGGGPLALRFLQCRGGGAFTALISSAAALTVGQLHHVAVTSDGTTMRLWLDGAQVASAADGNTTGDAARAVIIGGANADRFAGDVFDVAYASTDLSALIPAIYAAGPGAP